MNVFLTASVDTIINGRDSKGTPIIELFAVEYFNIFNEAMNLSCSKCIDNYLTKYRNHMTKSPIAECGYKLLERRNNIRIAGTNIHVNNQNITTETAEQLLKMFGGVHEDVFAVYPVKATKKPKDDKPAKVESAKAKSSKAEAVNSEADKAEITKVETSEADEDEL